ncbi:hypothetical protein [Kordiimonas pumila]|uniref:Uncharacterized protein n=1 Tax=Kordiimonas pumila TaxID=2161677 RepID=A0ABV7D8A3_9PROT|nr:hypothetical protein [Kordiimonas pumila]
MFTNLLLAPSGKAVLNPSVASGARSWRRHRRAQRRVASMFAA